MLVRTEDGGLRFLDQVYRADPNAFGPSALFRNSLLFDKESGGGAGGGEGEGEGGEGGEDGEENLITLTQEEFDQRANDRASKYANRKLAEFQKKELNPLKQKYEELEMSNQKMASELEKLRKSKPKDGEGEGGEGRISQEQLESALENKDKEFGLKVKGFEEDVAERDERIDKLINEMRKDKLVTAATGFHAINAEQIAKLLLDDIGVDEEGQFFVKNEAGEAQISAANRGQPMTINEHVQTFLAENQHMVEANFRKGSGGGQGGADEVRRPGEKTLEEQLRELEKNGAPRSQIIAVKRQIATQKGAFDEAATRN